jgi:hypothetical protein
MRRLVFVLLVLLADAPARRPLPTTAPDLYSDAAFGPPAQPVSTPTCSRSARRCATTCTARPSRPCAQPGQEYGLLEALYNGSKTGLKLDYDASYTRNAAETYRDRAGNCMSLVIMTAAFAKELGMRCATRTSTSRKAGAATADCTC